MMCIKYKLSSLFLLGRPNRGRHNGGSVVSGEDYEEVNKDHGRGGYGRNRGRGQGRGYDRDHRTNDR